MRRSYLFGMARPGMFVYFGSLKKPILNISLESLKHRSGGIQVAVTFRPQQSRQFIYDSIIDRALINSKGDTCIA